MGKDAVSDRRDGVGEVDWKSERRIEVRARARALRSVGTRTFYYFIVPVPYFYRDRARVYILLYRYVYICLSPSQSLLYARTEEDDIYFIYFFPISPFALSECPRDSSS